MSGSSRLQLDLPDDMLRVAMNWSLRLGEKGADRAGFEAWLAEDPRHADAFERALDVLEVFDRPGGVMDWARDGAIARMKEARRRIVVGRMRMAAAGVAVAVLAGAAAWPALDGVDVYTTSYGERRYVKLADGSRLMLDAQTKVRVHLAAKSRDLQLVEGQARFDVAHDANRPFIVAAGDRSVTARGTTFNVDMLGRAIFVTLVEGRVEVAKSVSETPFWRTPKPSKEGETIDLSPGQQFTAEPDQAPKVTTPTMDEIVAWQEGKLLFRDAPMGEAVRRVNRYSERKISLGDARVAELTVSGVFPSDDPERFIEAITRYMPVSAERIGNDTTVLHVRAY